MREIGGYIEFEYNYGKMLHENAVLLNCGRRAFSYLIKSRKIHKIWIPKLSCNSVAESFKKEKCEINYYSVDECFLPILKYIPDEDWIVLINYYGQINNDIIREISKTHPKLIVDNTQSYFQMPVDGIDTIYTCRKFFGVADGAILYTLSKFDDELAIDESYKRMTFLMGRFERTASEFYGLYVQNNELFENEPIKKMSKLTENILHGIDYNYICSRRFENFKHLDEQFSGIGINKLKLSIPKGAFMYPLYIENGKNVRIHLQEKNIYIPTLWPDVYEICMKSDLEYDMAANILPLPVDQRYGIKDMDYIVSEVMKCIE